jgi:transcriptional regulator with XRE-family HTH domain
MPPAGGKTFSETLAAEEFSRRLYKALLDRQMSASDLAREVWGTYTDKRGYDVARNRDRISQYLKGQSLPEQRNLVRIAEILGMKPEDLAPEIAGSIVERENPEIAMTAIAGHTDKVLLRVHKLVPLPLAAKIIQMLSDVNGNA